MQNQHTRRGNTQMAVIKQSIIPEFVSGSSTHGVTKQQALKTLKKFQGLSYLTTTHGFTLIELLVVVLIIGILAAVALPQYNKAVKKAKTQELFVAMDVIEKELHASYLEYGQYPTADGVSLSYSMAQISISLPQLKYWYYGSGSNFSQTAGAGGNQYLTVNLYFPLNNNHPDPHVSLEFGKGKLIKAECTESWACFDLFDCPVPGKVWSGSDWQTPRPACSIR